MYYIEESAKWICLVKVTYSSVNILYIIYIYVEVASKIQSSRTFQQGTNPFKGKLNGTKLSNIRLNIISAIFQNCARIPWFAIDEKRILKGFSRIFQETLYLRYSPPYIEKDWS